MSTGPDPQANALRLANGFLSCKFWVLFKGLSGWALGRLGPLREASQFTAILWVLWWFSKLDVWGSYLLGADLKCWGAQYAV